MQVNDANHIQKLIQLIESESLTNIDLALQIIKGMGLPDHRKLHRLLLSYRPVKVRRLCLQKGFFHLFQNTPGMLGVSDYKLSFSDILPYFSKLSWLQGFDFSNDAALKTLPRGLEYFTHIKHLQLAYTSLTTLPGFLQHLSHLEQLNLSYTPFKKLPIVLSFLLHLKTLHITGTLIDNLPDVLPYLSKLEQLYVSANHLQNLDAQTERHLKKIKEIWVPQNEVNQLPAQVLGWTNLRTHLPRYWHSPGSDSPFILLDAINGVFQMKGNSIMEEALVFYEPTLDWWTQYQQASNQVTRFHVDLHYWNTSSSKLLLDVFSRLDTIPGSVIVWHLDLDDEELEETGYEFAELVKVPFEFYFRW
ncbi:SiaC family regulatory phosphoprotein [Microscilla marina]|uniref:Leucine Rich Repeat domain protein n=1 Tax=Microscilla marina ATCC 23134 TaxID=313606 RepID=A1ZU39_MICM2|nr:SiaC family regulatory phosphoprotein [Microscilla marina]EAY26152.1 leucine Rich Repeat domain protein [Microscilla marina ATCC 23134]